MEMGCSSGRIPLLWVLRTLVVVVALCGHDAQISIVAISSNSQSQSLSVAVAISLVCTLDSCPAR